MQHTRGRKIHVENFFDQNVSLAFNYFDPDAILDILKAQGFQIRDAIIRYPYESVEPQTKRAYIFAQK